MSIGTPLSYAQSVSHKARPLTRPAEGFDAAPSSLTCAIPLPAALTQSAGMLPAYPPRALAPRVSLRDLIAHKEGTLNATNSLPVTASEADVRAEAAEFAFWQQWTASPRLAKAAPLRPQL